jgi:hypothetical protein
VLAYDTLSSDGETWGNAVAFCLPFLNAAQRPAIHRLGPDREALRPQDREAILFDTGVGRGLVSMCIRTADAELIDAFEALEGQSLLEPGAARARGLILKVGPNRVLLSPLGRIEVFSAIPGENDQGPTGPHTHLLPKLIATGRTHGANAPIPNGLQPVLNLHPRSPWRDAAGMRTPYDPALAQNFDALFQTYGLAQDKLVRAEIEHAVACGADPARYTWPESRRGRAQARITLRRLALQNPHAVSAWKSLYDRGAEDEGEDEAAHA